MGSTSDGSPPGALKLQAGATARGVLALPLGMGPLVAREVAGLRKGGVAQVAFEWPLPRVDPPNAWDNGGEGGSRAGVQTRPGAHWCSVRAPSRLKAPPQMLHLCGRASGVATALPTTAGCLAPPAPFAAFSTTCGREGNRAERGWVASPPGASAWVAQRSTHTLTTSALPASPRLAVLQRGAGDMGR